MNIIYRFLMLLICLYTLSACTRHDDVKEQDNHYGEYSSYAANCSDCNLDQLGFPEYKAGHNFQRKEPYKPSLGMTIGAVILGGLLIDYLGDIKDNDDESVDNGDDDFIDEDFSESDEF